MRYLYAVVDRGTQLEPVPAPTSRPTAPSTRSPAPWPGPGLAGEPLRLVLGRGRARQLAALVGTVHEAPPVADPQLRAHDRVVRRLVRGWAALLPARFGVLLADEPAVRAFLLAQAGPLGDALRLVRGAEQMTVRLWQPAGTPRPTPPTPEAGGGPGTHHLRTLLAERQRRGRVLAWLREALGAAVLAERQSLEGLAPVAATAYHLIARRSSGRYRARLARVLAEAGSAGPAEGWVVQATGPFPAYAFAPSLTGAGSSP